MSNPTPKPIDEQLLDLFNAALAQSGNSTEYALEDLTFGTPVAYDPETIDPSEPEAHNTSLLVTAGEGLEQVTYNLHYTRLSLERLFAPRDPELLVSAVPDTTYPILEDISEHIGFVLSEDDVEDLEIVNGTVTVTAVPESLAVFGSATILAVAA